MHSSCVPLKLRAKPLGITLNILKNFRHVPETIISRDRFSVLHSPIPVVPPAAMLFPAFHRLDHFLPSGDRSASPASSTWYFKTKVLSIKIGNTLQ
jgi:hypothetical protein